MKICSKCGVAQKDENFRCIECGAVLPPPVTEEEEWRQHRELMDKLDSMAEDKFVRGTYEKIMTFVNIIGLIVSLVLFFSHSYFSGNLHISNPQLIGVAAIWFTFGAVLSAFPKLTYKLEELRVRRWFYVDNLSPSDASIIVHKVVIMLFTLMAVGAACYSFTS